jgi:hypothetical protein
LTNIFEQNDLSLHGDARDSSLAAPSVQNLPLDRASRILVPLLILLFLAQCAWFIRTQSFTNDEPEHLVAGAGGVALRRVQALARPAAAGTPALCTCR